MVWLGQITSLLRSLSWPGLFSIMEVYVETKHITHGTSKLQLYIYTTVSLNGPMGMAREKFIRKGMDMIVKLQPRE